MQFLTLRFIPNGYQWFGENKEYEANMLVSDSLPINHQPVSICPKRG